MCLRTCNVRSTNRWNWDGDLILRDTTIRVRRRNPATRKPFRIDLREFLGTASNSVVAAALDAVVAGLRCPEQLLFRSRARGSFDLRVRAITSYLTRTIRYEGRGRAADTWLFPAETLDAGFGDCEDLAFLLAALLLASGVSGYVVRVAFGRLHVGRKQHDHAWVMYRDEGGRWLLLDPLLSTRQLDAPGVASRRRPERSEYEPRFVFNDSHLWAMKPGRGSLEVESYLGEREFLEGFDPTFAAGVHSMIYDSALKDMGWVDRSYVKAVSLAVDGDTVNYDPRDHFDNGYVEAGWELVRERLASGQLGDFALAAHAIGDFYAHSSYGHFALQGGKLAPLDERTAGAGPSAGPAPDYSSGGIFPFERFTRNQERCTLTPAEAVQAWAGRWISGRYAQPDDPEQGFIERVLTPYPNRLEKKSELGPRACLPHHGEIAVDKKIGDSVPAGHRLYGVIDYKTQFEARWRAASDHLADAYARWKANGFGT